ncbi:MAG: hypothetical protein ABIP78_07520, partial [Pyrinomonadaceae bacterium]
MKYIKYLLVAVAILFFTMIPASAQQNRIRGRVKFDAELAKKLGADDLGMKHYVLVILKTGAKDAAFKGKERDDILAGHMANIGRLAEEGKLAVAGPFEKNDKGYRGLYIF